MAKLKLPEALKSWKVISASADKNGYPSYKISRTEFDGSQTEAILTVVTCEGDQYNSDNVDLINEEASFVKNVMKLRGVSHYLDAVVDNKPAKNKITFYLLTEDLPTLQDKLDGKPISEQEIVDFGMQLNHKLEKLEQNNILHGNLKPENIYLTPDGGCKLGGFTAFDNHETNTAYTAPELLHNGQPDYTTDIYSLGLMMYTMANNGKLPFEQDGDKAAATQKRLSMAPVSAPANGSEKLKSVIVIACQPENKNRWKNAGNLKNALSSIKAELPAQAAPAPDIIPPESTDFESNVFEEFAFEEPAQPPVPEQSDDTPAQESSKAPVVAAAAAATVGASVLTEQPAPAAETPAPVSETPAVPETPAVKDEPIPAVSYKEPEIDNRVFDNYVPESKLYHINDAVNSGEKDYGDFFEEEPAADSPAEAAAMPSVVPAAPAEEAFEDNAFYDTPASDEIEPEKTSNKKAIAAIIIIALMLAAIAAYGVYAYQNSLFPFGKTGKGADNAANEPSPTSAASDTVPATTVPSTTAPATKPSSNEKVTAPSVIDFSLDYATMVLEAQDFKVAVSEYRYSDEFANGRVISMSPDGSEPLPKGSTISLVVSMGPENGGSVDSNSDDNAGSNDSYGNNGDSYGNGDSDNNDSDSHDGDSNDNNSSDGNNNVNPVNTASQHSNTSPAAQPANRTSDNNKNDSESTASNQNARMRVSSANSGGSFTPCAYNTSYLSESDVSNMSQSELNLALNEIYARRGRIFTTPSLASYFNAQSWYQPLYDENQFWANVVFNDYESKNVDTIRTEQIKRGYY